MVKISEIKHLNDKIKMEKHPKVIRFTIRQMAHLLLIYRTHKQDSEFYKTVIGVKLYTIYENFIKSVSDGRNKIELPLENTDGEELIKFIQGVIDSTSDKAFTRKLATLKTKITNELKKGI